MPVLIALGVLAAVVGAHASPAGTPPSAAAATTAGGCGATVDRPPEHRCVAPGKCGRACKTDGDCPAGRRCAELNLMDPQEESSGAGTVTTCVIAAPE